MRIHCWRYVVILQVVIWSLGVTVGGASAEEPASATSQSPIERLLSPKTSEASAPPAKVEVAPVSQDTEIAERLRRILNATEWFHEPSVNVREGVVTLAGKTSDSDYRDWATKLAEKTSDVVAVVNRMEVTEAAAWDFAPARAELRQQLKASIAALPVIGLSVVLVILTIGGTWAAVHLTRRILEKRMSNKLLRNVAARTAAIPVILFGVYLVLRVSGLTQMAVTVLGGTGLAGLIIGIAFRDIAENFLASILISIQHPFEPGDLVDVAGHQGYVQRVTLRGTVLITLEGNHVQIPNSTIYKSIIKNLTANPNVRLEFVVGISYANSTSQAQEIVIAELQKHPSVLRDPEPLVLVDELAATVVNLRVYFWIDSRESSSLKTRSSILRLAKTALQTAGISVAGIVLPGTSASKTDEAATEPRDRHKGASEQPRAPKESKKVALKSEGGLASEQNEIEKQARSSRQLESGPDLLGHPSSHGDREDSKKKKDGKPMPV